jgi:hypothetical protein
MITYLSVTKVHHMATRFTSGIYSGYCDLSKERRNLELQLEFNQGVITGNGSIQDDTVTVEGTYSEAAPYNVTFTVRFVRGNKSIAFEGFWESTGGMFGTCSGDFGNGDFHLKSKTIEETQKLKEEQKQKNLQLLLSMGFSQEMCEKALESTDTVNAAIEWLTQHSNNEDTKTEDWELPTPSEDSINLLVAMGFSHDAAANALVLNGNDVQRAIDWLFSNK